MPHPNIESFNGKLRDECLNGEIFYSLKQAQIVIEKWRVDTTRAGRTRRWATGRRLLQPVALGSQIRLRSPWL